MSGGLSNDTAKLVLNAAFGGTAFSPADTYLALATATILRTDVNATDISECAYTSYARLSVAYADFDPAADPGTITNANVLSFPECTGAGETATDVALVDSSSGSGLVIAFMPLGIPLAITTGMTPEFDIGALIFNLSPAP